MIKNGVLKIIIETLQAEAGNARFREFNENEIDEGLLISLLLIIVSNKDLKKQFIISLRKNGYTFENENNILLETINIYNCEINEINIIESIYKFVCPVDPSHYIRTTFDQNLYFLCPLHKVKLIKQLS